MNNSRSNLRRRLLVALLVVPLVLAAACGDDGDTTSPPAGDTGGDNGNGNGDELPSTLEELAEAAREEGALTIYSEQPEPLLQSLADVFSAEYPGIEVRVVRDIHQNLAPSAEVELQTGRGEGDIYITTDIGWFTQQADAGNFLPVRGPELTGEGSYDAGLFVTDDLFFEVGGAVNIYAWNTQQWPDGLTGDPEEFLDPELAGGRIALIDPSAPVYVDWYMWLEARGGEGYLERLAEQDPRVYQGAAPINEAVVSGEVSVTPYAFPPFVAAAQDAGAPIDFGLIEDGFWGAAHQAGVLASAPHPNAAMLFANFLVTAEAQEIINEGASAVIPGAAFVYNADMAPRQDLSDDDVSSFQDRFRELFVD